MPARTREKNTVRSDRYRVEVVERADEQPRRDPSLPHLRVSLTTLAPGAPLDAKWERRRTKRPGEWGPIRYDLMDDESFDDHAAAKRHERLVIERLTRRGHAVNGKVTTYRTYVIELDGSKKPELRGWLYVGQTSKPVAERIEEHRTGRRFRHSSKVAKNFRHPRPDLADEREYYDRGDAELAESRLRVRLERLGYAVEGGQERYDEALGENEKTCSDADLG